MSLVWLAPGVKLSTFREADERIFKKGSKSLLSHCAPLHAVQLRAVHKTLRVIPAMEAGITDHVWTIDEILRLSNGCTTRRLQ